MICKKPYALIGQVRFCEGFRQQCLILLDLCQVALATEDDGLKNVGRCKEGRKLFEKIIARSR